MDLINELQRRTDIFNKELEGYLQNNYPEILYKAARYLPMAGGKRLRPCISMLSCESVGGNLKQVLTLTVAIELIHNFTLVHDDIMDKSNLRRNLPTVHKKFGKPTAIIAGDLLFAKAFEIMHNISDNISILKRVNFGLTNCVREICEGQQLDMDFEKKREVSEEEYLEMIRKKTAILFEFSAKSGAILGEGTAKEINALGEYGEALGLAFQIQDDYLDMSSDEGTLGKDIGNDIRNGKKTLIAVRSINNAIGDDKKILNEIFGNSTASEKEVKKVYDLFEKMKSIEYAKNIASDYSNKARKALDVIKDSEIKQILIGLAEYSITREK
jgi:geranylgeranyl diphosphate synthase type I